MINNNALKLYYVSLQLMYENAVNMMIAINQTLTSSSSQVEVTLTGENNDEPIKLPSFLYLENKVELMSTILDNLFNMPESGEAWFQKTGNMYKLEMVRSNTAPVIPSVSGLSNIYASYKDNPFLKDLVSPKMFLKMNISNLPDNVDQVYMRKIVIYDSTVYDALNTMYQKDNYSYAEYKAALDNYEKGVDYEEYDSVLDLPIKSDVFNSKFDIQSIIEDGYIDEADGNATKLSYKIEVDTLTYTNKEDTSISFTLKAGDLLCLGNELVIYKVQYVDTSNMYITIQEHLGHIALLTINENDLMTLTLYVDNYDSYHYVEIPLEENPYILVFIGTIYNNVRSLLSTGYLFNLYNIMMYDSNGNKILDSNGNQYNYMTYYNQYCTNIGDMIYALTESADVQLSNYGPTTIKSIIGEDINKSTLISNVLSTLTGSILKVTKINNHITDDDNTNTLINYNSLKNQISNQLETLQNSIDSINSQISSNSFDQTTSNSLESLQSSLKKYQSEKKELQSQLNALVNDINTLSSSADYYLGKSKYRVRGTANYSALETYVQTLADTKIKIIGIDVEYKYRGVNKDSDNITTINQDVFTPWNKLVNIDREKEVVFNGSGYYLDYKDYNTTNLPVKWNQIDIPIQQGEDVVLRYRYKYNIGQPFLNVYTPWSDEDDNTTQLTITFPEEYKNSESTITSILETNSTDTISSTFSKTLINDGYQDHVNDSIKVSDKTFFHQPENIYSGFNTAENNMISLKDKLNSMVSDIDKYKAYIEAEVNSNVAVYIDLGDGTERILISNGTLATIPVYNSENSNKIIVKNANIIIKNESDSANLKLYSIFPGDNNTPLLKVDSQFFNEQIGNYDRVPMIIAEKGAALTLGQFLYFRSTIPTTKKNIYYNTNELEKTELKQLVAIEDSLLQYGNKGKGSTYFTPFLNPLEPEQYIDEENSQRLWVYRKRDKADVEEITNHWKFLSRPESTCILSVDYDQLYDNYNEKYNIAPIEFFMNNYNNSDYELNNTFLLKYSDIYGYSKFDTTKKVYVDTAKEDLSKFVTNNNVNYFTDESDFDGAFLYPNLLSAEDICIGDSNEQAAKIIAAGSEVSIPINFEYFLSNTGATPITKTISFDIRYSLIKDYLNYTVEFKGYNQATGTSETYGASTSSSYSDGAETQS